jgi:hypothetical protein
VLNNLQESVFQLLSLGLIFGIFILIIVDQLDTLKEFLYCAEVSQKNGPTRWSAHVSEII